MTESREPTVAASSADTDRLLTGPLLVHHFGPDPTTVGGMATVIRLLAEHDIGGDSVDFHATWRPEAPLTTVRLALSAAQALRQLPPTHVVHVHLSERGSFLREGSLLALARMRGLTTVATIHGASFIPFATRYPRLASAVLQRAHLVTCLDEPTLDLVQSRAPRVHAEILPNPVLVEEDFVPADQTSPLVVFAGEIGLRKGADVLHRAWELVADRCSEARCLMVGSVTDFSPPQTERLELRSAVDPIAMRGILRLARVVALPSRSEGMPMVLAEAMSQGRAFVSTPVGGIPELAASGGGVLVPVGDEIALADQLTELLTNPGLAQEMGQLGRNFCVETRSLDVISTRLRKLYAAAAEERNAPSPRGR